MAVAATCAVAAGWSTPSHSENIRMTMVEIPPEEAASVERACLLGGGGMDYGRDVICKEDGSCVLFGDSIKSFGESTDLLAIGLAADGTIQWARTYGGGHKDQIMRAAPSANGGFLVLGLSESLFFTPLPGNRTPRPLFLRLTPVGEVEWAVTLDGHLGSPSPVDAAEGGDGGWLVIMNREIGKPFLVKVSASGGMEWSGAYEFPAPVHLYDVLRDGDSGFLCVGRLQQKEEMDDVTVLALEAAGEPRWARVYGADHDQDGWSLTPMGGGTLVSGATMHSDDAWDILTFAIGADGGLRWASAYGTEGEARNEWSTAATRDPSGRTLLCGGVEDDDGSSDLLALVDDSGAMVATHRVHNRARGDIISASPLPNARFLVLGSTHRESPEDYDIATWTWSAATAGAPAELSRHELSIEERTIEVKVERREGLGVPHPFVDVDVKVVSPLLGE
jgi:hypothetical protein